MKLISWLLVLSCVLMADPGRRDRSDWEGYPPPPPPPSELRMPTWDELQQRQAQPKGSDDPCDTPEPKTFLLVGSTLAVLIRKVRK